jgi:hypothetical protein
MNTTSQQETKRNVYGYLYVAGCTRTAAHKQHDRRGMGAYTPYRAVPIHSPILDEWLPSVHINNGTCFINVPLK